MTFFGFVPSFSLSGTLSFQCYCLLIHGLTGEFFLCFAGDVYFDPLLSLWKFHAENFLTAFILILAFFAEKTTIQGPFLCFYLLNSSPRWLVEFSHFVEH